MLFYAAHMTCLMTDIFDIETNVLAKQITLSFKKDNIHWQ